MYKMRYIIIVILLAIAFFSGTPKAQEIEPDVIPDPDIVIIENNIEIKKSRDYKLEELPSVIKPKGGDAFSIIISKTQKPFLGDGRVTDAHETTHMIQAEARNRRVINGLRGLPASFYIYPHSVYHTLQPRFKKSDIIKYVPNSLRASRFNLYLQGQQGWNDYPLYILDEHIAYVNGAIVAIEDKEMGIKGDSVNPIEGPLEFAIYTIATCMAAKDLHPEFWANEDFQNFIYAAIKKSEEVFKAGRKIYPFERQESILRALQTSPDAEPIRAFLREHLDSFFLSI